MGNIEVDDTYVMPYGVHKGKQMADVPPGYLLWLLNEEIAKGKVKLYIMQNKALLEREAKTPAHTKSSTFRDNEFNK